MCYVLLFLVDVLVSKAKHMSQKKNFYLKILASKQCLQSRNGLGMFMESPMETAVLPFLPCFQPPAGCVQATEAGPLGLWSSPSASSSPLHRSSYSATPPSDLAEPEPCRNLLGWNGISKNQGFVENAQCLLLAWFKTNWTYLKIYV